MAEERLQKILARGGFGSRRHCEELITSGQVTINGIIYIQLGLKADPEKDVIKVLGERVKLPEEFHYLMFHKPPGCLCSRRDPRGRPTVFDLLPAVERGRSLFTVGRLDLDTTGLLLFTDDGQLAQYMLHPRYEVERVYRAMVEGRVDSATARRLAAGVTLEDGEIAKGVVTHCKPLPDDCTEVELALREGKKREVRRMLKAVGHEVLFLQRLSFGPLQLGNLKEGQWRVLTLREVASLRSLVHSPGEAEQGSSPATHLPGGAVARTSASELPGYLSTKRLPHSRKI